MLGRLFQHEESDRLSRRLSALSLQQPASPPQDQGAQGVQGPQTAQQENRLRSGSYTNEDASSRTVLYGTPNHLHAIHIEQFLFRMLVVQDKGELLQKNNYRVLFDSARDHHFDKPNSQRMHYRHAPDELIDFMFGNPIHQDFAVGDRCKIHTLSPLPDLPASMLITRYFKSQKKVFAIGVVVPVSSEDFSEAILANWAHLTNHLDLMKAAFISDNYERETPTGQKNLGLAILFKQLTTSIHNLVTTPRLLLGLTHASNAMFNHWCYEMHNWLEIKDGARPGSTGTKFLITLLTAVIRLKHQLVRSDYSDELVRVVILATNPIVAQKLICILSGVLPYKLHFQIQDCEPSDEKEELSRSADSKEITDEKPLQMTPPTPSVISKGWEIPTTPSRSIATPQVITPSRPTLAQPLSTSQSMAYLSSSLQSHSSFSTSLSRGFSLLQNWKNSLDSSSSSAASSHPSTSYRSPSPGAEYDEYPWNGPTSSQTATTPGYPITTQVSNGTVSTIQSGSPSNQSMMQLSLPRSFSTLDVNSPKKHIGVPRLPHIDRTTSTIYGVESTHKSHSELLESTRNECRELMNGSLLDFSYDTDAVKPVSVLTVTEESAPTPAAPQLKQTPPPLCGYVNEFIPEFQMQACPLGPEVDGKLISAMKKDLSSYNNSRAIYVPLRAREIREVVMSKGKEEVRTHVKRLYHNGKAAGCDRAIFAKVEAAMEALLAGKDIRAMVEDW